MRSSPTGRERSPTAPGAGHLGLCEWIAELHGVEPERVMITNGSMEGAALLFRHLVAQGDRVIVEQPTYDRTLLLLQQAGAEMRRCRAGGRRRRHRRRRGRGRRVAPRPRHPQLPQPRRLHALAPRSASALVQLAAEHGFPLFEDDPYRVIRFEGEPGQTMLDLDPADRVIHASSFSKTVSPGVRVGYLVGPTEQIATLAKTRQPDLHLAEHAGRVDRLRALPLGRAGQEHEGRQRRAARAPRRSRRGARGAHPRGRVRGPRRRLLPLARPGRRRRHHGAARRGQGRRASPSSPVPTSCSRAATRACGSRSRRSRPSGRRRRAYQRLARALERVRAGDADPDAAAAAWTGGARIACARR